MWLRFRLRTGTVIVKASKQVNSMPSLSCAGYRRLHERECAVGTHMYNTARLQQSSTMDDGFARVRLLH
jgi:hypothetical protein